MSRFFRNIKAEKMKKFLETKGYEIVNRKGDDEVWMKPGCTYAIKLPSRNEDLKVGTMGHIRRMANLCGVSNEDMVEGLKKQ